MITEDKSITWKRNRVILIRDTVLQLMYLNLECGECFGHRGVWTAQVLSHYGEAVTGALTDPRQKVAYRQLLWAIPGVDYATGS